VKKVLIYAYANFNLGDDLFIKILCDRYPKVLFILFAPKEYKISFKDTNNLKIIPNNSIIIRGINFIFRYLTMNDVCKILVAKFCDAVVTIGGSIFMQSENWLKERNHIKRLEIKDKPRFILGANFGPFSDPEYVTFYKQIFRESTDICFRDKYSFELFKDLSNVRLADDIVFQLNTQNSEKNIKNILISVIKPSFRKQLINFDYLYYKKIRDIAISFIKKGYNITFISFCESEGDKEAIESILKTIPYDYLNSVSKHLYKFNMAATLNLIATSEFVIATRFHSMILGWVYNKPVFPIIYSNKMINVIKDLEFKGLYTDFNKIEYLNPEEVFESMTTNIIDVSKQVKNAAKQFEKLDTFLNPHAE